MCHNDLSSSLGQYRTVLQAENLEGTPVSCLTVKLWLQLLASSGPGLPSVSHAAADLTN
jgi:hypothetical protein